MEKITSLIALISGILLMFLSMIGILIKNEIGHKPPELVLAMFIVLFVGGVVSIIHLRNHGVQ